MKNIKKAILGITLSLFVLTLAACGGSANTGTMDQTTAAGDAAQTQAQDGSQTQARDGAQTQATTAAKAGDEKAAATTAAAKDVNTDAPETGGKADDLLGEWVDVNDPTRYAKITQNGDKFQYEDNDGTYEATYDTGMMGVKVSDTDIADVYYVSESKELVLDFKGDVTKFKRK